MTAKPTKRQRASSDLIQAIIRPPRRYKHQHDKSHQAKIIKLRKQV